MKIYCCKGVPLEFVSPLVSIFLKLRKFTLLTALLCDRQNIFFLRFFVRVTDGVTVCFKTVIHSGFHLKIKRNILNILNNNCLLQILGYNIYIYVCRSCKIHVCNAAHKIRVYTNVKVAII